MAEIFAVDHWWKATEIPLIETNWRHIRLYCEQDENPFEWDRCVYVIRLAAPYSIVYGDECNLESPLVYIGSGNIQKRWSEHRDWLYELGHAIPGGRYEVWVSRPRRQKSHDFYYSVEAELLATFKAKVGCYPLRNKRSERKSESVECDDKMINKIFRADQRYLWAIFPREANRNVSEWYK